MENKILKGKELAQQKLSLLGEELQFIRERFGFQLNVAIISSYSNPVNKLFLKNIKKAAAYCGIEIIEITIPENFYEKSILKIIKKLSTNTQINGIMIQESILATINLKKLTKVLDPSKDVDCIHSSNINKIMSGEHRRYPAMVAGIIEMLTYSRIPLAGSKVVVVHRNHLISLMISSILSKQGAQVKILNSAENKGQHLLKQGEVIISGIGKPNFIDGAMIRDDAVIFDVGFNVYQNNMTGDVKFQEVIDMAKAVTPVPGGVGPLAIAAALETSFFGSVK